MSSISNSKPLARFSNDSVDKGFAPPDKKSKVDDDNVLGDNNTHQLPMSCDDPQVANDLGESSHDPKVANDLGENSSKQLKPIYSDEEAQSHFSTWCGVHGKSYHTEEERNYMFNLFKGELEVQTRQNLPFESVQIVYYTDEELLSIYGRPSHWFDSDSD